MMPPAAGAADEFSVAAMVRGYVELYGEVLQ